MVIPPCPACGLDDRAEILPGRGDRRIYWCARCFIHFDGSLEEWAAQADERTRVTLDREADAAIDALTDDDRAKLRHQAEAQVQPNALGRRLEPQVHAAMRRLVRQRKGAA